MAFFYRRRSSAEEYLRRTQSSPGRVHIDRLKSVLPARASVLEIGMGSGADFDELDSYFNATGSDYSKPFLDIYQKRNPHAALLKLDARTLTTPLRFDGIYSNKVLHHLKRSELAQSLKRQAHILHTNGCILHTFWQGQGAERHRGLRYTYWSKEGLFRELSRYFQNIEIQAYAEVSTDDSLSVLARRR